MLWFLRAAFITIVFFVAKITGDNKSAALPVTPDCGYSAFTDLTKTFSPDLYFDNIATPDSPTCIVPFSRAGNLILIKARADTTEGNFILDTGAPHLVLNITYFRSYPSTVITDAEQAGITGTVLSVTRTRIDNFSFGTFEYSAVDADLVNLGHIENSKGVKILGLIGLEFFKQCEMIIDYEKSLIYLHRINRKEAPTYKSDMLEDASAYSTISIETINNKIVARTMMAGKKLRFMIDYGAESNLLDSRLPNKIFENIVVTGRVILHGSGTQKVEALAADIKNIRIGNENISSLPVLIVNLEKTCLSYDGCIDGILGFDFLSLHKIGFNFVQRKMYIWK